MVRGTRHLTWFFLVDDQSLLKYLTLQLSRRGTRIDQNSILPEENKSHRSVFWALHQTD
jgi:hypothetical protein